MLEITSIVKNSLVVSVFQAEQDEQQFYYLHIRTNTMAKITKYKSLTLLIGSFQNQFKDIIAVKKASCRISGKDIEIKESKYFDFESIPGSIVITNNVEVENSESITYPMAHLNIEFTNFPTLEEELDKCIFTNGSIIQILESEEDNLAA